MIYVKTLTIPMFPIKVNVIITDTIKEAVKKYPHLLENFNEVPIEEYEKSFLAYTVKDSIVKSKSVNYKCVHVLFRPKDEELTVGILAHEAVHTAHSIFEYISYDVQSDNDEIMAYLVGWLTDSFLTIINDSPSDRSLPTLES